MDGRPLDVLEDAIGDRVSIRLKDGEEYRGVLAGYDQHMNVVLDPVEEPSAVEEEAPTVRDTTVIRGDNVVTIRHE